MATTNKDLDTISSIDPMLDKELDEAALEAALPTLTAKLLDLKENLSEDEKAVLSSIVTTSAIHLKSLRAVRLIQKSSQPHKTPTHAPPKTPANKHRAADGSPYVKPARSSPAQSSIQPPNVTD